MNILAGFLLPFRAVPMILRDSKLLRYSLIPWSFNILVFIGALAAFGALDRWLMGRLSVWLGAGWWTGLVVWTLGVILFVVFGAGLILTFTYLINIIASVFAEQLSYHTELKLTGNAMISPEGFWAKIWVRAAVESIKGFAFFLSVWAVLLLLNLIPVIGIVLFGIVSTVWAALSLAFEFTAPVYERRGLRFSRKRKALFSNFPGAAGFGAGILVWTMIPLVNLFFFPFAVVAGTLWVVEAEKGLQSQA
ncbi:EI24 domain-containing protein [bacterium]|nr:EI24 domain-containing protein [candidate division CSSED10-310 bacterium]